MKNPLYKILNPLITGLLRSSWHEVVSGNLMLISFTGRRTGRRYTTPVRYVRKGADILCFTTPAMPWWRNLLGGAAVELLIAGETAPYHATALRVEETDERQRMAENLTHYFSLFPGDVRYYFLRLDADGKLSPAMLEKAMQKMIVIEARKVTEERS